MKSLEEILIYLALVFYFFSFALIFKTKSSRFSIHFLAAGVLAQLLSIIIRWVAIGHPPIFGSYEASLHGSWWLAVFIAFTHRSIFAYFRGMILTALPMVIAIMLYGLTFTTERKPMTLSEFNYLVDFHALFAWLAYAPFTLSFCLALIYLFRHKQDSTAVAPEIIDELSFRFMVYGFINHTIMFALGCYYSSTLYLNWWMWDPVESTSLITWLVAGLYIHVRLFYKWRAVKSAWLNVVFFLTLLFSYWGLIYLPQGSTFHVFDTETKVTH